MRREKLTADFDDQIRHRAYKLYEPCGREDGHDVEDWLRAEDEIKQKRSRTVVA